MVGWEQYGMLVHYNQISIQVRSVKMISDFITIGNVFMQQNR